MFSFYYQKRYIRKNLFFEEITSKRDSDHKKN